MTAKRFYINKSESTGKYPVFDRLDDDNCVAVSDVERISQITCDLLNALHEENKQVKHDAGVLICSNQEYRKENEQLKEEIKDLNDVLARYEEKELRE